jgi:hypothetical protein
MKELNTVPQRISGRTLFLTSTGYFKNGWAILTGNELYLYKSKIALSHSKMFIVEGAKILSSASSNPVTLSDRGCQREFYKLEI